MLYFKMKQTGEVINENTLMKRYGKYIVSLHEPIQYKKEFLKL